MKGFVRNSKLCLFSEKDALAIEAFGLRYSYKNFYQCIRHSKRSGLGSDIYHMIDASDTIKRLLRICVGLLNFGSIDYGHTKAILYGREWLDEINGKEAIGTTVQRIFLKMLNNQYFRKHLYGQLESRFDRSNGKFYKFLKDLKF